MAAALPDLRTAEDGVATGTVVVAPKALVSWSTGKDSAYALHEARRSAQVEVVGLLTTVTASFGRVSMHGVRESLLDRQIEELALPCTKIVAPLAPIRNSEVG
jgi:diphthamide synthase (EF-2-diphthine--ammonia ligase)